MYIKIHRFAENREIKFFWSLTSNKFFSTYWDMEEFSYVVFNNSPKFVYLHSYFVSNLIGLKYMKYKNIWNCFKYDFDVFNWHFLWNKIFLKVLTCPNCEIEISCKIKLCSYDLKFKLKALLCLWTRLEEYYWIIYKLVYKPQNSELRNWMHPVWLHDNIAIWIYINTCEVCLENNWCDYVDICTCPWSKI